MQKYFRPEMNEEIKTWLTVNLANHLKTNPENQTEIEHIVDFLLSDKAPSRLQKMSYSEAHNSAEKWVKTMIKKGAGIIETEEDVKVIFSWDTGMRLVQLVGKSAFEREGNMMRHCVKSYFGKSDCKIYSLRDEKNMPHCTMEIKTRNDEVYQIKGKGNGSIHPKYIKYILESVKKLGKDVRVEELKHLGYFKISDQLWRKLDEEYTGVQELTFNNTRLLYSNCNFKKKEA